MIFWYEYLALRDEMLGLISRRWEEMVHAGTMHFVQDKHAVYLTCAALSVTNCSDAQVVLQSLDRCHGLSSISAVWRSLCLTLHFHSITNQQSELMRAAVASPLLCMQDRETETSRYRQVQ